MPNPKLLLMLLLCVAAPVGAATGRDEQAAASPDEVLRQLTEGNARFVAGHPADKDWRRQVAATAMAQYPKAIVLSCVDSRVPVEAVFDQGVGDIFVARVAGNVVGEQTLGSLEFATKLAGAKLVMVLGHGGCGAVKGAIAKAELGHMGAVLTEIAPAVAEARTHLPAGAGEGELLDASVRANVLRSVTELRRRSPVLAGLERTGAIRIVGAYYDLHDGKVTVLP